MPAIVIFMIEPSLVNALAGMGCPPAWSMLYMTPFGLSSSKEILITIRRSRGPALSVPCHAPVIFWACNALAGNVARAINHSSNFFMRDLLGHGLHSKRYYQGVPLSGDAARTSACATGAN